MVGAVFMALGFILRSRCGTSGTGLALVARLGATHLYVADMAFDYIHLHLA